MSLKTKKKERIKKKKKVQGQQLHKWNTRGMKGLSCFLVEKCATQAFSVLKEREGRNPYAYINKHIGENKKKATKNNKNNALTPVIGQSNSDVRNERCSAMMTIPFFKIIITVIIIIHYLLLFSFTIYNKLSYS